MSRRKALIVGLGNPGPRYDATRHNVGFEVVRLLAERLGLRPERAFDSDLYRPSDDGAARDVAFHLLAPGTFMNRSGTPTRQAVEHFEFEADEVLVVYDDLDLPLGRLRLKERGSSGGHRGLADIARQLAARGESFERIPRLRIGIGRNPEGVAVEDYVLEPFADDEAPLIAVSVERAADAALTWFREGPRAAMDRFNRDPATDPEPLPREGARDVAPSRELVFTNEGGADRISAPKTQPTPSRGRESRGTLDKEPQGVTEPRLYEGMFLFDANQTVRRWAELEDRVHQIFQKNDASLQYSERWPDQRLAYEIKGCRKGTHFLTYFKADPSRIAQIRRDTELSEDILRVLILHEEGLEQEMESRRKVAERRASEPAPAAAATPDEPAEDRGSRDDSDTDSDSDDDS